MPLKSTQRTFWVGASAPIWKLGSAMKPASPQSSSRLARISNAFWAKVHSLIEMAIVPLIGALLPPRCPLRPRRLVERPVFAGVEDEWIALARLERADFAGDDHVVAGRDHVAQV